MNCNNYSDGLRNNRCSLQNCLAWTITTKNFLNKGHKYQVGSPLSSVDDSPKKSLGLANVGAVNCCWRWIFLLQKKSKGMTAATNQL